MSTLNDYLAQKREALQVIKARALAPGAGPRQITARVRAEGRSGVRRIRIRDFQVISDSGPDFAGYDLGPTSPELQLGVLGSCVTHITLIQAADLGVPLESLAVELAAEIDPRAGKAGFEHIPVYPQNVRYTLHIVSPARASDIARLHAAVERTCPILNLLRHPQAIVGTIKHETPEKAAARRPAASRKPTKVAPRNLPRGKTAQRRAA